MLRINHNLLVKSFIIFVITLNVLFVCALADKKASSIQVMALFNNKVMVSIDDQQHLLNVGGEAVLGVKLIKATSKYALLEIDGEQKKYTLGNRVQATYEKAEKKVVHIFSDGKGMFKTTGSINGYTVDFLVDTGASAIALNSAIAKRIGLQYKLKGEEIVVATASGNELAYSISLDRVKVGDIMFRNINAVVLEGNSPSIPLLGMSFLGRLNMNNEGSKLSLEEKF